jgi:hypothetical protein
MGALITLITGSVLKGKDKPEEPKPLEPPKGEMNDLPEKVG